MENKGIWITVVVAVVIVLGVIGYESYRSGNGLSSSPDNKGDNGMMGITYQVSISDFNFDPPSTKIHVGDAVIWTNGDSTSHTATSSSGESFSSGIIAPGRTYTHTFTSPGTYSYSCTIHPDMMGTIIVQ